MGGYKLIGFVQLGLNLLELSLKLFDEGLFTLVLNSHCFKGFIEGQIQIISDFLLFKRVIQSTYHICHDH